MSKTHLFEMKSYRKEKSISFKSFECFMLFNIFLTVYSCNLIQCYFSLYYFKTFNHLKETYIKLSVLLKFYYIIFYNTLRLEG